MPRGSVTVNEVYCKGCGLCVEVCVQDALELAPGLTRKGYHPARLRNDRCTGCGNCAIVCPDAAITVVREVPASRVHAHVKATLGSKRE